MVEAHSAVDTGGRFDLDLQGHTLFFRQPSLPSLQAAMRLVTPARPPASAHPVGWSAVEIPPPIRDWVSPSEAAWFLRRGVAPHQLALAEQTHGNQIAYVERPGFFPGVDGLYTTQQGIGLVIRTADCIPVLIYCRQPLALGLAHAGWRGVARGIVPALVQALCRLQGISPTDLQVVLFPYIGPCCYRVGKELKPHFPESAWLYREDGLYLNLGTAVREQLQAVGVPLGQVKESGFCTACAPLPLYSYRKSGTGNRLYTLAFWR